MNAPEHIIELDLPIAVSENRYRRVVPGMPHPIISREGRKYHDIVKFQFVQSAQKAIHGKVKLTLENFPPDRIRRDLDNQFKCLIDSLVRAQCIDDDSLIVEIHAFKRETYPGGMNHIRIERA